MYAPVGRRDFLRTDMSIEDGFQAEAANHELLADIERSFVSSHNESSELQTH